MILIFNTLYYIMMRLSSIVIILNGNLWGVRKLLGCSNIRPYSKGKDQRFQRREEFPSVAVRDRKPDFWHSRFFIIIKNSNSFFCVLSPAIKFF